MFCRPAFNPSDDYLVEIEEPQGVCMKEQTCDNRKPPSTVLLLVKGSLPVDWGQIELSRRRFLGEDFRVYAVTPHGGFVPTLQITPVQAVMAIHDPTGALIRSAMTVPPNECANAMLWVRGYKAYTSPRASRVGDSATVYHGAAQWRVGGKKVTVLVQSLPPDATTSPHYHRTEELYLCMEGGFTMARLASGGGTLRRDNLQPGCLVTVEPLMLHPIKAMAFLGALNLVCCVRARCRGDGILRNHFWKDVAVDVCERAVAALGDEPGPPACGGEGG